MRVSRCTILLFKTCTLDYFNARFCKSWDCPMTQKIIYSITSYIEHHYNVFVFYFVQFWYKLIILNVDENSLSYHIMSWYKDIWRNGQNTPKNCFFWKYIVRGGGWFFGPQAFIILKSSYQDLSNEKSKFILRPLDWSLNYSNMAIFDKFRILASFTNLRQSQDSEFSKFWS